MRTNPFQGPLPLQETNVKPLYNGGLRPSHLSIAHFLRSYHVSVPLNRRPSFQLKNLYGQNAPWMLLQWFQEKGKLSAVTCVTFHNLSLQVYIKLLSLHAFYGSFLNQVTQSSSLWLFSRLKVCSVMSLTSLLTWAKYLHFRNHPYFSLGGIYLAVSISEHCIIGNGLWCVLRPSWG